MLEAYQFWEDETSDITGLPVYMTRSGDPSVTYIVEEQFDEAQAALDSYDEAQAKKEDKAQGISRYVKAVYANGDEELPEGGLAREDWFDKMGRVTEERNDPFAGVDPDVMPFVWKQEDDEPFDPTWYDEEVQ